MIELSNLQLFKAAVLSASQCHYSSPILQHFIAFELPHPLSNKVEEYLQIK